MDLEFEKHCTVYADGETMDDVINNVISVRSSEDFADDAFYVMDLGYVVRMIDQWKRLLPRVYPYYAVKSNHDPFLLQTMAQMNLGFDCASMGELQAISEMGVHPSRIVYSNPHKQISHLKYASSISVDLTVFDTEEELYKIKDHAPNMRILLRLFTSRFESSTSPQEWHDKFGCPLEKTADLLKLAKKLHLNVHGVCFHVGIAASVEAYVLAIKASRTVFNQGREMGFNMKILDLGGGFPCKTVTNYCKYDFTKMASQIGQTLDEEFPVDSGVDIIAEPGTYFALPSTTLVVNVIGKRLLALGEPAIGLKPNPDSIYEYVINDGIYQSLLDFVEADHIDLVIEPVAQTRRCEPNKRSRIWGQSLAADLVKKECKLPEMMVGEFLKIIDVGSYSSVLFTNFNGFKPRKIYRFITQTDKKRLDEITSESDASSPRNELL